MKYRRYIAVPFTALSAIIILLLVACCSKKPEAQNTHPKTCIETTLTATNAIGNSNSPSSNMAPVAVKPEKLSEKPQLVLQKSDLNIKKISRSVAYSLPVFHLNQLPFNENIATNAFNLFIDSLDPARSYFLQSDIDAFAEESPELAKRLRKGDISFAQRAFDTLLEHIENRLAYTEELLETGFDTSIDETFLWDRQEADWVKTETEWDELWRKRIKNEYVARLVSQQVYADEKEAETNTVDSAAASEAQIIFGGNREKPGSTITTNIVANADASVEDEYDEESELATLSPEEFILERYKQFKFTMETFDEEMLLQRYLTAFSHVYDPHSDYMSPSSVEDFDINMKLSLVGIGAMLRPEDGAAKIVRIIPGGPADQDGRLKAGDKIIAVAQGDEETVSILHWPLYKAVRLIRGEKSTKVVLTVIPAADRSGTHTKTIDLIRDEVKLEEQAAKSEVKEFELEDGNIRRLGIILLPDFYADFSASHKNEEDARRASSDVQRLVDELILEENIDGLVLDLRNNGGGSLVEAIEIAGLFISSGPVVQVKERAGVQVLPDADPEVSYDGPMVVLVNRLSASASEILAAALQDYQRAIIVGDKQTHGKGTVQTLMSLGSNRRGSLKLTTAGFYRINGGSTQLKGVTPDIIIPSYLDVMDIGEDALEHALPWDTIRPAMYRTEDRLAEHIPLLAEQSRERIGNNEEFQVFLQRRERLKERFETKMVSLSLEERIAEAEAEKELDDIQSGLLLDAEDDAANDIVLDETLSILADMIDLQDPARRKPQAPVLSSSETPVKK